MTNVQRAVRSALAHAAGVLALCSPVAAHAQASLEEIVVTAQKRNQDLQDVPMSVTAISAETLERMSAVDFFDYATRVPNLSFSYGTSGQFGSQNIAIRGVFGRGTTGFYIDEIPVPESMNPAVMDVQHVEVLRGPQGTLYGARSMGGTVKLMTVRPDTAASAGSLRAGLSSTQDGDLNYRVDGTYNAPLSENAAVRLSAYTIEESGVFDRVYGTHPSLPPGTSATDFGRHEGVDDSSTYGGQIMGLFSFLDGRVRILPRVAAQQVRTDGLSLADADSASTTHVRLFDTPEPGKDRWAQYSVTLEADVAGGNLTSVTGWLDRKFENREDYSELGVLLFGMPPQPLVIRADDDFTRLVHETRFSSSTTGAVSFTAGVYYADTETKRDFPGSNIIPGIDEFFGGAFGTDVLYEEHRRTDSKDLAAFGEITWSVTPHLTAILGARWSDSEIDFRTVQSGIAVSPDTFSGTQREKKVTPKALVQYALSDDMKVYASAAQGFRTGGVNSFSNLLCAQDLQNAGLTAEGVQSYDTDTLWSYELGLKSAFRNGATTLNAAAFAIDWSDVQQLVPLQQCGFVITLNAGAARSRGFELELDTMLGDAWRGSLGVGYTDSEVTRNGGFDVIRTGVPLQQVPKWTGTAALEYHFDLAGHEGYARADCSYTGSSTSTNNDAVRGRTRGSYAIAGVRAGMTFGRTDVSVFATNLTDERANLSDLPPLALELPGRPRIVTNRPRTVGLEAHFRF
jgi:outer membrane receptor protein involved in Fe transport